MEEIVWQEHKDGMWDRHMILYEEFLIESIQYIFMHIHILE